LQVVEGEGDGSSAAGEDAVVQVAEGKVEAVVAVYFL
jgi:hypothetical protein